VAILYTLKTIIYNGGVIHRLKGCYQKPATLYDVGGWFLILAFLGAAVLVGIVVDYFWNYLVLYLSLRWLHFNVNTRRKFIYCLIITSLGLLIDWLYYELTWGYPVGFLFLGNLRLPSVFSHPGSQPILELSTILIPIIILAAVNFVVSHFYLRMIAKQAIALGTVMGVFTAPWLIVGYVLVSA